MATEWALWGWTALGVGGAFAALGWVRPQRRGVSPPHVMLALGCAGMLLGLLFDLRQTGAVQLGAVCAQAGTLGLLDALALHLRYLPGMHAGMLAGGLLAIPVLRRLRPRCKRWLCSLFTQNLLCSGWMVLGMTWGGLWLVRFPRLLSADITAGSPGGALGRALGAPLGDTLPGMLGGMFVGMSWGMVASVALYRAFFVWRNWRADSAAAAGRPSAT